MPESSFERILLHQDDAFINAVIAEAGQYRPYLDNLKKTYEEFSLTGTPFDYGVFDHIKESGIEQIIQAYIKQVDESMTETGLMYERLRNMVLEDAQMPIAAFRQAYNDLKGFRPKDPVARSTMDRAREFTLPLDYISFDNDSQTFKILDHHKDLIAENFRIYVSNAEEKALYDTLTALRQPLKNYYHKLIELKIPKRVVEGWIPTSLLNEFLSLEYGTDKVEIKPESIKWGVSFKNK